MKRLLSILGIASLLLVAGAAHLVIQGLAAALLPLGLSAGDPIWVYDSDLYIRHVETAFLDGDSIPDIIAGEYDNNSYYAPSRVYGISGATGGTLWSYLLQDGVRSMAIGDINNDGVMDAVAGASNGTDPDGRVHAIDGTDGSLIWTFTPGGVGDTNADVAVGDFNGDQYPDVAVACWDDHVYAVDGEDGTELWSRDFGSIFINAVATGDVNGDNIDDVAFCHEYLANFANSYGVLDGVDGTSIWEFTAPFITVSTLIADIDGDSDQEAIFGVLVKIGGSAGDDEAWIHVRDANTGALEWSFSLSDLDACSYVNSTISLYTYDVDGDTDDDLVVGNWLCSHVVYAFDGGSATPLLVTEDFGSYPRALAFGDVTGDGNLNIAAVAHDKIEVADADVGGGVWAYSVAGTFYDVTVGDFDDDGTLDVAGSGGAEFSGTPQNPAKSVWALKTVPSPLLWQNNFGEYGNAVAIANLDGDVYEDVTVVSSDDVAVAVDGETGLELWTWVGTANLYAVTSGDFDNNGQEDVAVAGADNTVTALDGSDGTIMWQFTSPTAQIYRKGLGAADLNSDSNVDVIAGSDDDTIYAINGITGLELWSNTFDGDVEEVELAQMNGTGPLDIVAAIGWPGNRVVVLDGSNGQLLWQYDQNTNYVRHVEVLDADNDSVPDVAIGVPKVGSGTGSVILVDGVTHTAVWTASPHFPNADWGLSHADLNGDDSEDVLLANNYNDPRIYAFNGENGNELWNYLGTAEFNVVNVADVNGDGDVEVLAGADDQILYVLDKDDGALIYSFSTTGDVMDIRTGDVSGSGVADNIVCTTFDTDGALYAFKSLIPNNAPGVPAAPSGPVKGAVGISYWYSVSSTDPDDDSVYFKFDWGNGLETEWMGPYASGVPANIEHVWYQGGTHQVRVKARDTLHDESAWSPPLAVTILGPEGKLRLKPF